MTDDGKLPLQCSRCSRIVRCKPTQGGNPRPPAGWTRVSESECWCGDCWADAYVTRAVTVSITTADWDALRTQLRTAFGSVRSLANWAYSALLAAEPPRDPNAEKMPKKPSVYLYGVAKEHCPFWGQLPATISNAVLRQVESDYSADRYEVVWTGARSTRSYRYPQPIPVPEQNWSLTKDDDGYSASLSLGERVSFRLALRKHQQRIVDMIFANPLLRGSCKIIEHREHSVPGATDRANGNGSKFRSTLRIMISYYAPRDAAPTLQEGEWRVSTGPESLLVAVNADDGEVWRYNADHAKRIVCRHADHLSRLGRLSDDRKHETRRPRREARPRLAMLDARATKDKERLRSACHEIATHLVNAASRRKIVRLIYSDKDHSFCESFPWAMLREMVEQRCHKARIVFEHVNSSGSVLKKKRQPLATKATE